MPFNPVVRVRNSLDVDEVSEAYQSEGEAFVAELVTRLTSTVATLREQALAEFDSNGGRLPIVKGSTFMMTTRLTNIMVLFELATPPYQQQ
jgi:hypothetical protein